MPDTVSDNLALVDGPAEIAERVHDALETRVPLVDYGASHRALGNPPPATRTLIVQRPKKPVIDVYPRDFTIRLAAGVIQPQIVAALKPHNQFFPLEMDADMTLGEVINHNVYGPLRQSYGSVRDLLLGLQYIDGAGRDIHVGGRTVKNVAGYDVTRFMVGSLGELGIVHEAVVRTYAVPEQVLIAELTLQDATWLDENLTRWLVSEAAPAWMLLSLESSGWCLRLGYFGPPKTCSAQLNQTYSLVELAAGVKVTNAGLRTFDEDRVQRLAARTWRRKAAALVRIVVPPGMTGAAAEMLRRWSRESAPLRIDAMPSLGTLFTGGDLDIAQALSLDTAILSFLRGEAGFRAWHCRPGDGGAPAALPPFAPQQPDWAMLHRIKAAMDPAAIFNPGRFIAVPRGLRGVA